jgi:inositol-phosphate phosphatase / L-galactose 1-phosphate phosphatase / histidinol-phosphatase
MKSNNLQMSNKEFLEFANHLTNISEEIIINYYRKDFVKSNQKKDQTPVSIADTEVERIIREEIKKKYPKHGIIGEEFPNKLSSCDYNWYIDPIDGTSAFICGKPTFTTLICLTKGDQVIVSIINQPITKDRWIAYDKEITTHNGKKIKTRNCKDITDAVLTTTSPALFASEEEILKFDTLRSKTKYQKYGGSFYGGDALNYALLANGFIDIVIESGLKNHDFLPLIPIVKNSGGFILDWQGKELNSRSKGNVIACSSKVLLEEALKITG